MSEKPPQAKDSGINRIVNVPEETEESLLDYFKRALEKEGVDRTGLKEHPPELDKIIERLNSFISEFVHRYGGKAVKTPLNNVFTIDLEALDPAKKEAFLKKAERTLGSYNPTTQSICVLFEYDPKAKLKFLATLVHEIMHLNSFHSFQSAENPEDFKDESFDLIKNGGEDSIHLYGRRGGFAIGGPDKPIYFKDIDEALTEELAMRFDWEYFKNIPEIKEEFEEREEAIIALANKEKTSPEKERRNLAYFENMGPKADDPETTVFALRGHSYPEERVELQDLISKIYTHNKEDFKNEEEIFTLFAKAYFSGNLLPVARLIEKTLGKGSFRALGEKTAKKERGDKSPNPQHD